jgi:hypothetical protein
MCCITNLYDRNHITAASNGDTRQGQHTPSHASVQHQLQFGKGKKKKGKVKYKASRATNSRLLNVEIDYYTTVGRNATGVPTLCFYVAKHKTTFVPIVLNHQASQSPSIRLFKRSPQNPETRQPASNMFLNFKGETKKNPHGSAKIVQEAQRLGSNLYNRV